MNPAPHGGNLRALASSAGRRPEDILDFSASINPLGPPEWLRPLISRHVAAVVHYPDPDSSALVEAVAKRHGVPTDQVIVGNGSTEIIHVLPRILCTRRAVIPVPSYSDYLDATRSAQLMVYAHALRKPDGFALHFGALDRKLRGDELVFLGQPNNPTGLLFDPAAFGALAERHPRTIFVVDEAFADFVVGYQSLASNRPPNVVVVRSMTKFYAIPGLRLGYALADKSIAERAREKLPPWSVNVFAQAVGEQALADEDYARQTREFVATQRDRLVKELSALPGLQVYPGQANFLLVKIRWQDANAAGLAHELLREHGIAIRVCDNFEGLDARFFRVAVRTETENERLISSLASALGGRPRPSPKRKTPALMFQGTSSSAGKSILTTALCRILLQDGYRVAPFKAQNMSLNSFVTRDGGEMGRAQVVQAQACRLEPDVRMNPILLKPCTDTGAQVILMGKPVGNMNVLQYTSYKSQAFDAAKKAFDSLAAEYDVIVLEGAGSPGEVNLKARDIVNMRMARYAQAPVLLVGDIDRGGVYASFVGTMEVLAEWERALVAGFVVNKFRGDESLLGPAHDYVLRHTGKPVLGVVPYLKDLNVPQEDSVEFKSGAYAPAAGKGDRYVLTERPSGCCAQNVPVPFSPSVDIAVVDLPHISNFTDFDAFRIEPDVRLRIARAPSELDHADAVVIPGSKNVIADLLELRRSGLAERILQMARSGEAEVVGLCGGFQMMGREIADPHGIESAHGKTDGLGLLAVTTVLAREKTLTRVNAVHALSGHPVFGYEIHHGLTSSGALTSAIRRSDGEVIGVSAPDQRVWGTYLHGIFDADEFRRWFIDRLRQRRGLSPLGKVCAAYDLEAAFDRLADAVRRSLRIPDLYRLMGLP